MRRVIGLVVMNVAAALAWANVASAQPQIEGAIRQSYIRTPSLLSLVSGNVVWSETIREPGTRFLRIHFTEIVDTSATDFNVVIRNANFVPVLTYDKSIFRSRAEFWTGVVFGDTAVVEITASTPPRGFSFSIREYLVHVTTPTLLSISGPDQRQPIKEYRNDPIIWKVAKSVAKLMFVDGGSLVSCTGFMVSPDLMMTNEHCINKPPVCDTAVAIFGYELGDQGITPGTQFRCQTLVLVNERLDVALIRLDGSPGAPAQYGSIPLSARDAVGGESLYIIGHPAGEPKQISKADCSVTTAAAPGRTDEPTDFGHKCDTLGGNSGSPMLDVNGTVVGLHHLGFSFGRWAAENRAVQMKFIQPLLAR